MRKVSPRLVAIMMAGAVTVTSITPVTGYQTITVNAATDSQEKEAAQGYQTNLTGFDYKKGDWKETKDGLYSSQPLQSDTTAHLPPNWSILLNVKLNIVGFDDKRMDLGDHFQGKQIIIQRNRIG